MRHIVTSVLAVFLLLLPAFAQSPELSDTVKQFVRADAPKIVLTHVRVIDGTGASAVDDQNVIIEGGKISAIQQGAEVAASAGAAGSRPARIHGNAGYRRHAQSSLLYRRSKPE